MFRNFSFLLDFNLLNSFVFAHVGVANGFLHPLTGVDHLIAMIAVGIWSAQIGGKAIYIVPSCFLSMMFLGGVAGLQNIQVGNVEVIIALSVLLLGLAILLDKKHSIIFAGLAVAVFGFVHGFSHGSVIPNTVNKIEYITGVLITTLGLHVLGAVGGLLILEEKKGPIILRFIGLTFTIIGVYLTCLRF